MVNGKFKGGKQIGKQKWLPFGSSPTAKMGVLDEDGNPSIPPTGDKKSGKLANPDDVASAKKVTAEVVQDSEMTLKESLDYAGQKLAELKSRMENVDRKTMRAVGEFVGSSQQVISNLADIASDGKVKPTFNIDAGPLKPSKRVQDDIESMSLQEGFTYASKKLAELKQRRESIDRKTYRAIGDYVDSVNATVSNLAKEAGMPGAAIGGTVGKLQPKLGKAKKPKQLPGSNS